MRSPLGEEQRDALVAAMLPDVPFDGWSRAALRTAAKRLDMPAGEALALFPGGPGEIVAAFSRWADRRMLDRLAAEPLEDLRTAERIALALKLRFAALAGAREAVRRSLPVLALPPNAPLALRLLYETVDGIWYAAGDGATDFSFYTKRASLAAILAAATVFWLDDRSEEASETQAFIARRLAEIGRLGQARGRFAEAAERLPNPLRLIRPLR